MKIKLTNPVTIVPAQPGWFVATTVEGSDKLDKEAVIAWAVSFDKDPGVYRADPITYNTERNFIFDMASGYLVCQPHGMIIAAKRPNVENNIFYSESEAVEWSKNKIAKSEVKIVFEENHPKSRGIVVPIKPPEEPES